MDGLDKAILRKALESYDNMLVLSTLRDKRPVKGSADMHQNLKALAKDGLLAYRGRVFEPDRGYADVRYQLTAKGREALTR